MGGAEGQASDIEIRAEEIKWLKKRLYQILAHHTDQSFEQIEDDADRNYWMSAEEAKDYGLVDNILNPETLEGLYGVRTNGAATNGEADASDDE
jgi:ATP-dependent Clp protease protease subunit